MNLKQAARHLGVHYQTAYKLVRSGRLAAVCVGARYEISEAAIERYLAERQAMRRAPARARIAPPRRERRPVRARRARARRGRHERDHRLGARRRRARDRARRSRRGPRDLARRRVVPPGRRASRRSGPARHDRRDDGRVPDGGARAAACCRRSPAGAACSRRSSRRTACTTASTRKRSSTSTRPGSTA